MQEGKTALKRPLVVWVTDRDTGTAASNFTAAVQTCHFGAACERDVFRVFLGRPIVALPRAVMMHPPSYI